jgi:hypothetical protein
MMILSGCWIICMPMFPRTYGTPSGQHWLRGVAVGMPVNSRSECFFTASAACGFRIGLL